MTNNNHKTDFYKKYVGSYAKRFYQPFRKESMFKIKKFKLTDGAYLMVENDQGERWWWDAEDCVIITNEMPIIEEERLANTNDYRYFGYSPFTSTTIKPKK